jgi:type I restriction-modification system DNA methylase subunit
MDKGKPEAIRDRAVLFDIFKRVEGYLWEANIEAGLPRFLEFANLMFLKLLEEQQKELLWASLKAERNKVQYLNGFLIPTLQEKYNARDVFAESKMTKESVVKKIVAILDNYHLESFDSDILGDAYEYFLKDNISSKQNLGQYFTPRPIVKIMADLVSPTYQDTVYDPFCGTGGLLTGAFNAIREVGSLKETNINMFFGKDVSASTRVAKMNAILHWDDHSGIEQVTNTLSHPVREKYSIGLTNVPFARDQKNYQYNELYENGLARKKTDVLCILHLFQSIQKGGRMAAIVPEGFLFGTERSPARRFLTDNADLRLVVSLPHGTFLPYTHVKTALIYLENIRCPDRKNHFWYFDVEDGRSSLDTLQSKNFNEASEEELTALGYTKVPFEKIRQNHENWIGKHYSDSRDVHSLYPLVPLGKLVKFISTGFSYNTSQLSDDGIPLFTLKSVKKDFFPNCETKFLKYETQTNEKNICVEGDILIAMKDKNRESAILGRATIANKKGIFSNDLTKIEINAKDLLLGEYLYYFFKNETYIKEIKKFSAGSIVKSISLENMTSIKIPLPPLSIQKEVIKEFNQYEKLIISQNEAANFFHEKCRERLKSLWA